MNQTETKKIITAAGLCLLVLGAVAYMVFGSKHLLVLQPPVVSTNQTAQTAPPTSSGQVLGASTANPLKDVYINPFAK